MKALTRMKIMLTILILGLAVLPVLLSDTPWPVQARDYLFETAKSDTGADNTVSAIYLGYRAMDTLGETLVLLVSITGTMSILINLGRNKVDEESIGFSLEPEKLPRHSLRTNLIEVVGWLPSWVPSFFSSACM